MTSASQVPCATFHDGRVIPQVGLGVWQVADDIASETVRVALEAGYRHVDTAAIYDNERGVGEGIRASGLDRDEIFVTTKLWNSEQGRDATLRAFDASCERLGCDEVDLYLIHWPAPVAHGERYVETWQAMVELRESGRARSIGVSNFEPDHLERIVDVSGVVPVLNQVELHPYFQQRPLREVHERLGIVTESWSPLGQGGELLEDPVVRDVAEAVGATPAQVVIRWHVERGLVTIPKSQTPSRIIENLDVFDMTLEPVHLEALDGLDRGAGGRIGPDPATARF